MQQGRLRPVGVLHTSRPARSARQHSHLLAGGGAGAAGLFISLIIHHLWIMLIWFIAPLGAVFAGVGRIVIGRAYGELKSALPQGILRVGSVIVAAAAALLPSIPLAELREPLFTPSSGDPVLSVGVKQADLHFIPKRPLPAALIGAGLGRHASRTRRAALSVASASLVFALGPVHNIPFLGGTPAAGLGWAILFAVVICASIVLVGIDSALSHSG